MPHRLADAHTQLLALSPLSNRGGMSRGTVHLPSWRFGSWKEENRTLSIQRALLKSVDVAFLIKPLDPFPCALAS